MARAPQTLTGELSESVLPLHSHTRDGGRRRRWLTVHGGKHAPDGKCLSRGALYKWLDGGRDSNEVSLRTKIKA